MWRVQKGMAYYGEAGGLEYGSISSRMSVPLQSHALIREGKERWNDDDFVDRGSSTQSLTGDTKADGGMWATQRITVKKYVVSVPCSLRHPGVKDACQYLP